MHGVRAMSESLTRVGGAQLDQLSMCLNQSLLEDWVFSVEGCSAIGASLVGGALDGVGQADAWIGDPSQRVPI